MQNEIERSHAEIRQVVEAYIIAVHAGDTERLSEEFEPSASLIGLDEGELRRVPLEQWFEFMRSIPSPQSEGEPRDGKIEFIDISGTAAVAKVSESYRAFKYVDYLLLLFIDGRWRIANKCYHQFA